MNILGIIPARGGSKGILDKNIVNLNGKELIRYSLEQGQYLLFKNLINNLIVSTDSNKIAEIVKKYDGNIPFKRPKSISQDTSKSIEFVLHALKFYENKNIFYDAVLILQPTTPFRSKAILENAIKMFNKIRNAKSLISVFKEDYICDLVMYKKNKNVGVPLDASHNKGVRRQDHGSIYVRNGAIYITSVDYIKKYRYLISEKPLLVEMKKTHSINIDNLEDLEIAKKIMKGNKNIF